MTGPTLSHKELALNALDALAKQLDALPATLERRHLMADLDGARDEVLLIEELKRKRPTKKATVTP